MSVNHFLYDKFVYVQRAQHTAIQVIVSVCMRQTLRVYTGLPRAAAIFDETTFLRLRNGGTVEDFQLLEKPGLVKCRQHVYAEKRRSVPILKTFVITDASAECSK